MQLFTNNANTVLAAAINTVSLSIQTFLGDGAKFPSPTGGDFFLVTLSKVTGGVESAVEIIKVTARSGDVFTVLRAQEGTTALTYAAGDKVSLRLTAAFANALPTLTGTATLTNKTLTAPVLSNPSYSGTTSNGGIVTTIDINGGTIDGTVIGGASKAAGGFTDLTVTGNTTLGDSAADTVTVNGVTTYAAGATVSGLKVTELNSGPLGGFRNRIINGGFDVWDHGVTTFASFGVLQYTAARWAFYRGNLDAGATASRITGAYQQYGMRVQRDSGSSSVQPIVIGQIIESANCYSLSGNTVTLSARIRAGSNFSGANLTSYIFTGSGVDQGNISAVGTWTGTGNTGAVHALTTSYQVFKLTASIPAGTKEIAVTFQYTPTGLAGANDYFEIEEVQFEVGTTASNFEIIPLGTTRGLCNRYYRRSAVWIGSASALTCFPIDMFRVPVTISGGGAGLTTTGTTAATLICYQTTAAIQTLVLDAEL